MELKSSVPALDFIKGSGKKSKLLKVIIKLLETFFGTKVLFEIPLGVSDISLGLLQALNTASKLNILGVIRNVNEQKKIPDEPHLYHYRVSSVGRAYGAGVDFLSKEKAAWKSIAEATERYLWYNSDEFYSKDIIRSTYSNLGSRAMDIFSLAGFSNEQIRNFSILSFDKNDYFGWIKAECLGSKKGIYCPAQLFSQHYSNECVRKLYDQENKEPMLRWSITTGLATGRSQEEAIVKGIMEVIERDAFMITYLNKISPPVLDLDDLSEQDPDIAKVLREFKKYDLEVSFIQLLTDFPVFVFAAIIIDRTGAGPAFSIGASADFDLKTCLLDALSESHIVRLGLKNRYDQKLRSDKNNFGRQDRLAYWANAKKLPDIEFLIKGKRFSVALNKNFYAIKRESEHKKYYHKQLSFLTCKLKEMNYEAYVCELTTKPIKKIGLRTAQVVIPGLQPLHLNEGIPYLHGRRLKTVPQKLGYETPEELNQEPHPFP